MPGRAVWRGSQPIRARRRVHGGRHFLPLSRAVLLVVVAATVAAHGAMMIARADVEGAPWGRTGAASAREELEPLPAAQVCITDRYVKASAQDEGAEGECA